MKVTIPRMQAFIDSFTKVTIYLSTNYYNGRCDQFYLKDMSSHTLTPITVISTHRAYDVYTYECQINFIDLSLDYQIADSYGLSIPLIPRFIVYEKEFDELFYYDGQDLGPLYTKEKTQFKLWAPTAKEVVLKYTKNNTTYYHSMTRIEKGIYTITIDDDLENVEYTYLVNNHSLYQESNDPYAYGSTGNGMASVVLDLSKLDICMNTDKLPKLDHITDCILYEMSIRDFSMNTKSKNPGQFLGVVEEGLVNQNNQPIGFDHLKELGITHVQMMPMYDIASIDEYHPEMFYNWGYDPLQYNVPEGSYASSLEPYKRVLECKQMVSKLHEAGIRVVMDVVFNHVFDVDIHAFNRIVPEYFYRVNKEYEKSNGSFCSNDLNTTAKMVHKYIVDMCLRWQQIYGLDGYRFDLMGIIDIDTITEIEQLCKKKDPSFVIYGEGWNMPTYLEDSKKSMMDNAYKMKNIAFFNDQYRNILRGPHDQNNLHETGYLGGNTYLTDKCVYLLAGLTRFDDPSQTINYLECHDNCTLWDKFNYSNAFDSLVIRKKRQILSNGFILLSQGIPFLHSGQEFCRSKNGLSNTYNSPDTINALDWSLKEANKEVFEATKFFVDFRKKNSGLRYSTKKEVLEYGDIDIIEYRMLAYSITQDEEYKDLKILFNPSSKPIKYDLKKIYDLLYCTDLGFDKVLEGSIIVPPISMMILGRKEG